MKMFCAFVVSAGLMILAGTLSRVRSWRPFAMPGVAMLTTPLPAAFRHFFETRGSSQTSHSTLQAKTGKCSGGLGDYRRGQGVRGQYKRQLLWKTHTEIRWCGVLR